MPAYFADLDMRAVVLFGTLLYFLLMGQSLAQDFQVVSFNIRYGTPGDGENKWKSRRDRVMSIFKKYKDGIIATQEALPLQVDEILDEVSQLDVVYRSRTIDEKGGESNAIFYNKKTWRVIESETFWFSDTPSEPASKSWGNTLPRIATLVVMEHKPSGKKLRLLNAHLDHRSDNSRERSTELLLRKLMTEVAEMPTILLGDFNEEPEGENILRLKEYFTDAYSGSELEGCTYHNWNGGSHCPRIDYIFYLKSGLRLKEFVIDRWKNKFFYPSDHYPIVASFAFEQP
ncbi:endonuclease/exonuclease/phosphatase family protein [Roseivirga sp. UBA1976]|uniref:endonuclease/exonuclease/phosphatase family protein n=1 Tax=Roseivirga sp. UBA1976 TaxID=1947386 RepID=UPI002580E415|nr:endonuclease/exonuclease/phosphatase family protein [Roseivirga sp. UBA1976]MEC7754604.1 endonuclease/exonuclease/phosphatase family protein [Bacteroidota bacterium]